MLQACVGIAAVLLCIQYANGVAFETGIPQCDANWMKSGCYKSTISKSTMLINWREYIAWDDIKTFADRLACTCASEAKKVGASGFAIFWWGQCYALTAEDIDSLSDTQDPGTCYKLDGTYSGCQDNVGGAICAGDDDSVYVFTTRQIDGGWREWSEWSGCPVQCGGGIQERTRTCDDPVPALGGAPCDGLPREVLPCGEQPCPVNGGYGMWGKWSECSKKCGGGKRDRSRLCDSPAPAFGGKPCDGPNKDTGSCNTDQCPVDGGFGKWSDWSACSYTCGGGITKRTRKCDSPAPKNGGKYCQGGEGGEIESKVCSATPCHTNGGYTAWSEWTKCTVSCGTGKRERVQTCEVAALCGTGKKAEAMPCGTKPCPINGGLTTWSAWSPCTKICGGGVKSRERKCTNPRPQFNGKDCVGFLSEKTTCNSTPCPVNGAWSVWADWSNCTALCGGGIHERWRVCNNPKPLNGGKPCPGLTKEIEKCNEEACVVPATLPPHASCQVNPESRLECGYPGITKTTCESRGCCFNNKFPGVKWCYRKSVVINVCAVNPEERKECGFAGITKKQCESRAGCCFNNRTPGMKWCYRSINAGADPQGDGKKRFQLCEHAKTDTMYLSCPKGKSIFISQALYGRRSLTICPNTNHRNRRNCGSYWRSLRISRRRCQNRQKCTLSAKNSMFYDPCRGVEKYLDVTWHCRITPPKPIIHRVTICEHAKPDSKKISCPAGFSIYIRYALYGRQLKSICPSKNAKTTRCGSTMRTRFKARRTCNGKNSCTLSARNSMFGDPCRWTPKYLKFTYVCQKAAAFDNWSSWSTCTAKCGRGLQRRRRTCKYNGKAVYFRRCQGRRYQSKICSKECNLDKDLTNCISSNVQQIIKKDITVRRGFTQPKRIQKLGMEFEINFSFAMLELKRGAIFQIRRFKNKYRALVSANVNDEGTLRIQLQVGTGYQSFYFRSLKAKQLYTVTIQQKKLDDGKYIIYMKLFIGTKQLKMMLVYNTKPVTSHDVRTFTSPGWALPAKVKIQKLSIGGYCTVKAPAAAMKKVFTATG